MADKPAGRYDLSKSLAQWKTEFPHDPAGWSKLQRAFAHPIGGHPETSSSGQVVAPQGLTPEQAQAVTQANPWSQSAASPAPAAAQPIPNATAPAQATNIPNAQPGKPQAAPLSKAPVAQAIPNAPVGQAQASALPNATPGQAQATPASGPTSDPSTGIHPGPPPVGGSGGGSHNKTSAPRSDADAPVGIPYTVIHDPTGSTPDRYSTSYVPPMWVAGQGSVARTPDRPFDTDPSSPGADLPHTIVHSDGTITHDWYRGRDVYGPATQSADQVQAIQEKLVQAGLLDPSTVHWGLWGAPDQNAYFAVLGQANLHGVNAWSMLSYMAGHPNMPQVKLDSPITAQQALDSVVSSMLGRRATPDEEQRFNTAWDAFQTHDEQQPPTAGPTTNATSIGDFAKNYVDTNMRGEEQGQGLLHGLDLVHNLIGSTANAGG